MSLRRRALAKLAAGALATVLVPLAAPASAWTAPNDPDFPKQYGPVQIGAPDAWTLSTGAGVVVAVVDTGVDVDHPDLQANLVAGYDFADNDSNPDDDGADEVRGHGTHVAGIVAAVTNNGQGMAGTAPSARIMPLKLANRSGLSNFAVDVPRAIDYAVDNGAKVINLSIGALKVGSPLIGVLETPCADAYSRGALCVIAAGNGGDRPSGYARDVRGIMVGANDANGDRAPFSQWADTQWALMAPGLSIWSTIPLEDGGYQELHGTSMAAPHAAGVAALLFAQGLSIGQVVDRMLSTATPMGDPARFGAGRVDAAAAVGVQRTEPPAEASSEQRAVSGGSSGVLLPDRTRRPTSGERPSNVGPADRPLSSGDVPANDPLPAVENPDLFDEDLAGTDRRELALTAERGAGDETTRALIIYALASFALILLVGTGLTAATQWQLQRPPT